MANPGNSPAGANAPPAGANAPPEATPPAVNSPAGASHKYDILSLSSSTAWQNSFTGSPDHTKFLSDSKEISSTGLLRDSHEAINKI